MSAAAVTFRQSVLPWAVSPEDAARFKRVLGTVLLLCLLLALIVPWVPPPQKRSGPAQPLSQELTRLILESEPPPPPPKPPEPEKKPDKADTAPDANAAPNPAEGAAPPATQARNPADKGAPGDAIAAARRKVSGVGLLALKDQFADLRNLSGAPTAVQSNAPTGPGVGTTTGVGVGAGTEPGLPARDVITANAATGSGGISTGPVSRDTGGGGLAGRSTTLVAGVAGGGGGGGGGPGGAGVGGGTGTSGGKGSGTAGAGTGGKGGTMQSAGGGKASRSLEDVKLVFERNKGAIYAIYNRALREDPTLQGKVVLKLSIAPGGNVSSVSIESSELKAPELEQKLLARIRQFDFGAREVEPLVVTWPLDFLPS